MRQHSYYVVPPETRLHWLQQYSHGGVRLLLAIEALAATNAGWSEPLPQAALGRAAGIMHRGTLAHALNEISAEIVVATVSARRARYGLRCLMVETESLNCSQWAEGTQDSIRETSVLIPADEKRSKSERYPSASAEGQNVQKMNGNDGNSTERSKSERYPSAGTEDQNVQKVNGNDGSSTERSKSERYPSAGTEDQNVQKMNGRSMTGDDTVQKVNDRSPASDASVQKVNVPAVAAPDSTTTADPRFEGMNDHILAGTAGSFIPSTPSADPQRLSATTGDEGVNEVDYEPENTELGHWQRRRTRELLRLAGFDPDHLDLEANSLDWYRRAAIFRLLRRAAGEQGLSEDRAAELAVGRPALLLERDYDYWCYQVAKGIKFKNSRTGRVETPGLEWLVAQVQSGVYGIGHGYEPGWRWPELSLCPECGAEHRNGRGYLCDTCAGSADENLNETQPDPLTSLPPAPPQSAIPQAVLDSWGAALGAFELVAGRSTADRYRQAIPLAFKNGTLTLQVASPALLSWLQERRYRLLKNLVNYWLADEPIETIRLVLADMAESVA